VWRLCVSGGFAVAGAACRDGGEHGVGERGQGFDDGEVGECLDVGEARAARVRSACW
jgi:hypothetical protein